MRTLITAVFVTLMISVASAKAADTARPAAIASLLATSGQESLPENVASVPGRTSAYSDDEMAAATRSAAGVADLINGLHAAQRSCLSGNDYDAACVDKAAQKGVAALPLLFRPAAAPYVNRIKQCKTNVPGLYGRACVDKVVSDIIAAIQ